VALEMSEESIDSSPNAGLSMHDYGLETDWWSMGAMMYEMAYGVAPFFATDVRTTYLKIMDHKRSLRLEDAGSVSLQLRDLIERYAYCMTISASCLCPLDF
jgi:serine/threonine protein kinase